MGNTKIILDRQQTQILQDIGEISKGTIKIGKDTVCYQSRYEIRKGYEPDP